MSQHPFNNSFNVLAREQAKPGHIVLVSGTRNRGGTDVQEPHATVPGKEPGGSSWGNAATGMGLKGD
jgi:hypothetical protein